MVCKITYEDFLNGRVTVSYIHIPNLYKDRDIIDLFKECYSLEKLHGSSANITWTGEKLIFHSGGAKHQNFVSLFDQDHLIDLFQRKIGNQPATVYGEAIGGKLMGMSQTYGKSLRFVVFDVMINELWLSVPQADAFAKSLGLSFVHWVKIPTTMEAINAQRDVDSVEAERIGIMGKIREGVILRPLIELRKNNNERLIVKHKRDEFRETQEVRVVDDSPEKLKILEDAELIANEWVTAERLNHVVSKMAEPVSLKHIPKFLEMIEEDVLRESKGEIVDSVYARKAIKKKAVGLFKNYLGSRL